MKTIYAFTVLLFICAPVFCQVGGMSVSPSGSQPDASAGLDVNFTNKGFLMPRVTTAQRNAIANPASGLVVYNTDCGVFNFNSGTPSSPVWATINSSNALTAGVSITASPAGAICAGTSVTFSATPSQNNLSPQYQWQVNGVNTGTNSATYTTDSLNSGDVVTCILTSSAACVSGSPATSNAITMVVNTVPSITGTTAAGFCSGSAVTLSASANVGTINWYSVSTGGSSLSSGASFTVSGLTSTTTYYVDATANGCSTASRTAVTATFYPNAPGQPGAITGPLNVYKDSLSTYSISAMSNTATYAWTVSMGIIVSGQGSTSITVAWGDSSGLGSVSVAATNPCGTGSSQSVVVGVQTFYYTGSQQTFTIPNGVTSINITAYGAQGGSPAGTSNTGGLGGSATGTLSVTPGEVLYINTGNQPNGPAGGFNGGGNGAGGNSGGGGGASDIRVGGTGLANRVIVAGGGGGATYNWTTTGGTGGGTSGGNGTSSNGTNFCGQGGTQGAGGLGATAYGNQYSTEGSLGQGGTGSTANGDAGGGGGGYYGGGEGDAGGGGGGSGYTGGVTNGAMQNGVRQGNGLVIISW